jgi:Kef-type K+ transport system membrane component KefB
MDSNLKKRSKSSYFWLYIGAICLFFLGIWGAFELAELLYKTPSEDFALPTPPGKSPSIWLSFIERLHHPVGQLLIQILVVLSLARAFSYIFRKLHQPTVVGEILAGILLGPSALGLLFPSLSTAIFPPESLPNLQIVSQFGLIIFMFVIGMELDVGIFKEKVRTALIISHMSIVSSFLVGLFLAVYLYPRFAQEGTEFLPFGLFMGISMSIAAFPVLARIIQERGINKTSFGLLIITCAAVDDVSAWVLLAIIISLIQANGILSASLHLFLTLLYILFCIYILQPFLSRLSRVYITQEVIGRGVLSLLIIIFLFSALITETIGIHALFGAFLAGVIMPTTGDLRRVLTEKLEDFSAVLLLPLFFAFTGLRTQIGSLNSPYLWQVCGVIILCAVIGKFGGSFLGARIAGLSWRDSTTLGVLMNTRGLMELVVLNIGYDLGILSTEIFAIMVIMALSTTLLTGPLIKFLLKTEDSEKNESESPIVLIPNRVLIPFGPPKSGETLFKLAINIFGTEGQYSTLHLTPIPDSIAVDPSIEFKKTNFEGILKVSKEKKIPVQTIFQLTNSVSEDIVNIIKRERSGFVLMGGAQSLFGANAISGKVESILSEVQSKVGIFLDRGFQNIQSLLIYYKYPIEAEGLFQIAGQIQKNGANEVNLVYEKENEPKEDLLRKHFSKSIRTTPTTKQSKKVFNKYSLVIIGYNHWLEITTNPEEEKFLFDKNEWQKENQTSILILRSDA